MSENEVISTNKDVVVNENGDFSSNKDVVADEEESFPTEEQVRLIFRDTYNFYKKWITVREPNWNAIYTESHKIKDQYPFKICWKTLVELIAILENAWLRRENTTGDMNKNESLKQNRETFQ